jgi:lipopolysaccharide assembly outer membrane protein LptD (OstA)
VGWLTRASIVVCAAMLGVAPLAGQVPQNPRSRITAVVERALETHQRLGLSADRITLTDDVLHLSGKVRITIGGDTLIRADEATIDRGAGKVELGGNVSATLGPSSGIRPAPRIDYR